uniref:Small ribosomal subunit protein uS14c n=1 Tax=Euglena archaeoplastidiata TaxID=1188008 RepID=A0A1X9GCP8_9EUGL|nr:ribosomal protein S14 [Euglena archaeoplastidiata]AKR17908.1 ribosomal protein S14 [Euglena archaeoplastidiata]
MAKKSIVERERKRENLAKKYSTLRRFLKGKIKFSSSFEEKLFYSSQLQKLPRNSSFSRLRNRCIVTGRPRGYYRLFGLSRHVLRDMAHYGFLPGVTKSSW